MKKALSGAHFLMFGGALGLFVAIFALCIVNFSGDFGPNTRASHNSIWIPLAIAAAGVIAAGVWLHLRRRQDHPDYPDILGQLFPHAHLMEVDGAHLAAFGFQHGPHCRVVIVAQSLYDQPSNLRLDFEGHVNAPLAVKLPAGAVIMAWIDGALDPEGGIFKTVFAGTATIAGNRLRMRKRNLLGHNAMQNVALLMKRPGRALEQWTSGAIGNPPMHVIFADLAGKLPVQLAPASSIPACNVPRLSGAWQVAILWDVKNHPTVDALATQLAKVFGDAPVQYRFPFPFGVTADTSYALHPG